MIKVNYTIREIPRVITKEYIMQLTGATEVTTWTKETGNHFGDNEAVLIGITTPKMRYRQDQVAEMLKNIGKIHYYSKNLGECAFYLALHHGFKFMEYED